MMITGLGGREETLRAKGGERERQGETDGRTDRDDHCSSGHGGSSYGRHHRDRGLRSRERERRGGMKGRRGTEREGGRGREGGEETGDMESKN
jgi:hypothetical protein